MSRVFKLEVLESIETLKSLLKEEKDVRKRERLQFLFLYKSGQIKTRQALGRLLNRSHFAIGQWADTYRAKGLRGLLHLNYRGGNLAPSIPVEVQWQLKDRLARPEGFASYRAIQLWLKETHELDVPLSTVHGTVKYRLKAGPKVPRPHAEHHDPEAVEDFKKNRARHLKANINPLFRKIFQYSLLGARRKPVRPENDRAPTNHTESRQTAGQNSMAIQSVLSLWCGGAFDRRTASSRV